MTERSHSLRSTVLWCTTFRWVLQRRSKNDIESFIYAVYGMLERKERKYERCHFAVQHLQLVLRLPLFTKGIIDIALRTFRFVKRIAVILSQLQALLDPEW